MKDRFCLISARIQAFSQDEIIRRIPPAELARIKQIDPHPFFQLYSVAHEGVSAPKYEGEGHVKTLWFRNAIQSMKGMIKNGLKLFRGHNADSSHTNRPPIGEVIASFQEEIDGNLNQCFISYHPPDKVKEAKSLDVCSQESVWDYIRDKGQIIADKLVEITGIALENSRNEKPAFPGAVRMASIQAFESGEPEKKESGEPGKPGKGEEKKMATFQEIVEAVKTMNIHPSQLYSFDKIKADRQYPELHQMISENEKLKVESEETKKTIETMTEENKKLISEKSRESGKIELQKILDKAEEIKNPKVKKYIAEEFDRKAESMEDFGADSLQKYIKSMTEEYQRLAKYVVDDETSNVPPVDPGSNDMPGYDTEQNNPLLV